MNNATDYKTAFNYIDKTDKGASPLMTKYLEAAAQAKPAGPAEATEEQILAQYLKDKTLKDIKGAQTEDTTAWNTAQQAANKKTANETDTYTQWLKDNNYDLNSDANMTAIRTGTGLSVPGTLVTWATSAATAQAEAAKKLDDADVYKKYIELKVGNVNFTTAEGASGDTAGANAWGAAKTAAKNALGRASENDVTDEEAFAYYLNAKQVKGLIVQVDGKDQIVTNKMDIYAAARQDTTGTTGWDDAQKALTGDYTDTTNVAKRGSDIEKAIYNQWLKDNKLDPTNAQGYADGTAATGDGKVTKKWTDSLATASQGGYKSSRPATEAEAYSQYIDTKLGGATGVTGWKNSDSVATNLKNLKTDDWNAAKAKVDADLKKAADAAAGQVDPEAMNKFWNNLTESDQQRLKYEFGKNAAARITENDPADTLKPNTNTIKFDNADILNKAKGAMNTQVQSRDFAGYSIDTQENAQEALVAVKDAISAKDKTRAHLGALQNRLENTVSNLTIQSENLQAAESRISDVDVATEMTQFVRNQILTQSAVAMLSQANSMPQMAMQLIG